VWAFCVLLLVSIWNQWITLASIAQEISLQKEKLRNDYASIAEKFIDIFDELNGRIGWHRFVLGGVAVVGLVGSGLSTIAYWHLQKTELGVCASLQSDERSNKPTVQNSTPVMAPATKTAPTAK
jgi:hypothetical protein